MYVCYTYSYLKNVFQKIRIQRPTLCCTLQIRFCLTDIRVVVYRYVVQVMATLKSNHQIIMLQFMHSYDVCMFWSWKLYGFFNKRSTNCPLHESSEFNVDHSANIEVWHPSNSWIMMIGNTPLVWSNSQGLREKVHTNPIWFYPNIIVFQST